MTPAMRRDILRCIFGPLLIIAAWMALFYFVPAAGEALEVREVYMRRLP